MGRAFLLTLGLFFVFVRFLSAQTVISGRIQDAETGDPLPSAHVIVKGTYKGTISNADGEYSITVNSFPVTLVTRFMGYETLEKIITEASSGTIDFNLKESLMELDEITVTGEDPAISIMKEVIRRKQIWRAQLNTYKAEAYTRQQLLNDTTIVSISESISEAYWDKVRGSREVVKSRRQTANIEGDNNFAGVSYLPNFYDDNLEIAGFDVVGVTSPNALSYYDFHLADYKRMDDKVVFEIEVSAKRKLQPLFEGTIFVLDEDYALLSVKLKPNSVIVFPPPVQDFEMYYEQQFSNYGGVFWLPVDMRIEGLVKVGIVGLRFPAIRFIQMSKMTDYQVNVPIPDSLYTQEDRMSVDSTTINNSDSLFVATVDVVPLSKKEKEAYNGLDSTATLEKAFRPQGFLTRFLDLDEDDDDDSSVSADSNSENNKKTRTGRVAEKSLYKFRKNFSVLGRYNRVDALFAGLKFHKTFGDNKIYTSARIGYSTGYDEITHGAIVSVYPLKKSHRLATFIGYDFGTETRNSSELYSMVMTSGLALFGNPDYFDYYRKEGIYAGLNFKPKASRNTYGLTYRYEDHSSIDYKTSYNILGRDVNQRINPAIDEGTLSSFEVRLTTGRGKEAWGAIAADNVMLSIEQSAKMIGSDWDFTRFKIDVYKRFNTFYKRRFFPNTLDFRLNAGTYIGDLPVQKNGVLDVAYGLFTPFGAFRSKRYVPYEGSSYIALNAEHNFKSIPLELLGWSGAPKSGLSIIAFGGVGKTWLSEHSSEYLTPDKTYGWHSEAGISVSNIFNLIRIDVAYRLDKPGIYPGISVARLF